MEQKEMEQHNVDLAGHSQTLYYLRRPTLQYTYKFTKFCMCIEVLVCANSIKFDCVLLNPHCAVPSLSAPSAVFTSKVAESLYTWPDGLSETIFNWSDGFNTCI